MKKGNFPSVFRLIEYSFLIMFTFLAQSKYNMYEIYFFFGFLFYTLFLIYTIAWIYSWCKERSTKLPFKYSFREKYGWIGWWINLN